MKLVVNNSHWYLILVMIVNNFIEEHYNFDTELAYAVNIYNALNIKLKTNAIPY